MKRLALLVFASLFVSGIARADILALTFGKDVKSGVQISVSGVATVAGKTYPLITEGSGIRKKKITSITDIYVAQLLLTDTGRFVKSDSGALPSLDNQNSVAMRMDFKMDVPISAITNQFQSGFTKNNVSLQDPDIVRFLAEVNKLGNTKTGKSLTVFVTKNSDGSETLAFENNANPASVPAVFNGAKGLTHKIMALWLGDVSDDNFLVNLKAELLK